MPITNTKRNVITSFCCWCYERVQFTHSILDSARTSHIHSHTNLHSNGPHFFLYRSFFFSLVSSSFLLNLLLNLITMQYIHTYICECKVKLAFALKNKIRRITSTNTKTHCCCYSKRFFYGKVSIQWKSMQRPFQSTTNEIFLYVWTLNLAQTK